MDATHRTLAQHLIDGLNLEDMSVDDFSSDMPLFGEGLGLDSIDALELAVIIDRQYGVKLENNEEGRAALHTLDTLHQYIISQQSAEA